MPFTNERFDYQKEKELHKEFLLSLAPFRSNAEENLNDKEKSVAQEDAGTEKPLVPLISDELSRGSKLYAKCIACHGKFGQGNSTLVAPRIGGQYDWYIVSQLQSMKEGTRVNQQMMPFVRPLSEQDMKDLGAYVALLPGKEPLQ